MKSKQRQAAELAEELERLNALVRQRRKQLNFLERCPNKQCECRLVWRDVVEKNLATQVGKIRRHIREQAASSARNGAPRKARAVRAAR